jgi:5'-nucleotidase
MIVAVDVDEVCANMIAEWLRRYNRAYDDNLRPDDIRGWAMAPQVKPECGNRIYEFLNQPGFYDCVEPIDGALEAVNTMRAEGHRVLFVSSCVVGTVDSKVRWLQAHDFLPAGNSVKDFIAATDKSLIGADVLFDDHILNVEAFPGFAFLVTVPHNSEELCVRPRVAGLSQAPDAVRWLSAQ